MKASNNFTCFTEELEEKERDRQKRQIKDSLRTNKN